MADIIKQKPIFATMATADFYPEGAEGKYIEITVTAPFDSIPMAGKVVILAEEEFVKLWTQAYAYTSEVEEKG